MSQPPEPPPAGGDDERTRIRRPQQPPQSPQSPQQQPAPPTGRTRPRPDRGDRPVATPPQWRPPDAPTPAGSGPSGQGPGSSDTKPRPARPATSGPSQRLLYVAVSALVVSLAAAVIAVVFFSGDDGVPVSDLDRGACLVSDQLDGDVRTVDDLAVVRCDQTHQAQVAAVGDLGADQSAEDACVQALVDAGTSVAALSGDGRQVRPLATTDRVACLVVGEADASLL